MPCLEFSFLMHSLNVMGELYVTLNLFFGEIVNEGITFATILIREETGLTACDNDEDDVVLPPHMSKHICYERWCYQMGWMVGGK